MKHISENKLRDHIFQAFCITDREPWKAIPTENLINALRKNTGLSLKDLALLLGGKNWQAIRYMENFPIRVEVDRMAVILKPLLQEQAKEGWLQPDSYTLNWEQIAALAEASRKLQTQKHINRNGWPEEVEHFNVSPFEHNLQIPRNKGNHTPFPALPSFVNHIRLVANALCAIHGCESVKALLTKAAAVPEVHRARKEAPQPLKIAAASDEDIAGAQKAMLEFLGLHKAMLTPEILAHQSDISSPAGGTVSRTLLLPGRVAEAYRVQYDKEIPAEVRWHSFEELRAQGRAPSEAQRQALQEFTEQGLRLAALDMDLLRAGISQLLKEKGWSQNFMEAKGGIKGHMVSLFLNGRRRSTLSTIADMSKALGVADIFTLEEMGKAAMERVTSPQGQGANKRGKLLPEPQDAKERAGGHFTTAALRRMLDRGAFDKNRSK